MMLVPAVLILLALVPQDPVPLSIPMEPGLTIVQSVAGDEYQGRDYEAVISIDEVNGRGAGPRDVSLTSAVVSPEITTGRVRLVIPGAKVSVPEVEL